MIEPYYDQELEEKISEIIKQNNLDPGEETRNKIKIIEKTMEKYNLHTNSKIYDKRLFNYKYFPKRATKELAIIIACYKRTEPTEKLKEISSQHAATVRTLNRKGFIFKTTQMKNSGQVRYLFKENGKVCRRIAGFELPPIDMSARYIQCSKKNEQKFKKGWRDIMSGKRSGLELDHRTPVEACKKLGIQPKILTDQLIEDKRAKKYFQYLTRDTNTRKREACRKCLDGEKIILPDCIVQAAYKQRFDEACEKNKSCVGCFWHDYECPQYPEKMTYDQFVKNNKKIAHKKSSKKKSGNKKISKNNKRKQTTIC